VWLEELSTFIGLITLAFIGAMRIYALWERNIYLTTFVLVLGLVMPCATLYLRATSILSVYAPDISCSTRGEYDDVTSANTLFFAGWIFDAATNVSLVGLTWKKTFSIYRMAARARIKATVPELLLRDGTMYFMILTAFHITLNLVNPTAIGTYDVTALSSIVMSRCMLNLRRHFFDVDTASTISSFMFTHRNNRRNMGEADTLGIDTWCLEMDDVASDASPSDEEAVYV